MRPFHYIALSSLLLLVALLIPTDAVAQFKVAIDQGNKVISTGRTILNGMAVVAILAVAAMTMTGKVPWGWSFAIVGALILLALTKPDAEGATNAYSIQNWILGVGSRDATSLEQVGQRVSDELIVGGNGALGSSIGTDLRDIIQAFAGIAIVAMAIVGFSGRFPFKWLMAIIGGLIIVFVGPDFVDSAIDESNQEQAVRDLYGRAEQVAEQSYIGGRTIIYAFGALAAIGLGIAAMMGQWRWSIAFSVVAGLVMIAAIQTGLTYLTGEGAVLVQDNVGGIALPTNLSLPAPTTPPATPPPGTPPTVTPPVVPPATIPPSGPPPASP